MQSRDIIPPNCLGLTNFHDVDWKMTLYAKTLINPAKHKEGLLPFHMWADWGLEKSCDFL